jgi:alkanesulfonate monooxygenase SsuD/methylene tetrahydromethanopterin reductase-like flavin-dependent oxidoreductase (luciferase family)
LSETLGNVLNRPIDELRKRLLVGSPEGCAEKLAIYEGPAFSAFFIWPLKDEQHQLNIFQKKVAPLVKR